MENIFSKIDKKILMILSIVLIVALIAVFFIYKYSNEVRITVEDIEEQITNRITNPKENSQIEIKPQPGLIICADQCRNGVCQPADVNCNNGLNCVCDEDEISCPQDCQ